jgi:hypothetical protein
MSYLTDGFPTLIRFSRNPAVLLKEREVQPPDLDGGGEIDTTTMRNNTWRSKYPKSLITAGDCTLQVNYDPKLYSDILAMINKNQSIMVRFSDGSGIQFYGWIDKFTPASLKEGDFPMAEVKIHCSNMDAAGVEVGPIYIAALSKEFQIGGGGVGGGGGVTFG